MGMKGALRSRWVAEVIKVIVLGAGLHEGSTRVDVTSDEQLLDLHGSDLQRCRVGVRERVERLYILLELAHDQETAVLEERGILWGLLFIRTDRDPPIPVRLSNHQLSQGTESPC